MVMAVVLYFACKLKFYRKLSHILVLVQCVAVLASMVVFGALMHICGPQYGCGDLCYSCKEGDPEKETQDKDAKFDI